MEQFASTAEHLFGALIFTLAIVLAFGGYDPSFWAKELVQFRETQKKRSID